MRPKWKAAIRKGAVVSLSGNLGFVALDEVLRLLSRSNQQGAVDVRGDAMHGRIFVGKRGIDLATMYEDEELRRHLTHSGLAEESHLRAVEAGQTSLATDDSDVAAIVELIREMTVESLYQLADRGTHFEVYEHSTTPYASPKPFELEEILAGARRRAEDWKAVRRTIPDLDAMVDFRRELGDRAEVKVGTEAWKVITEIRAGSSVAEIADRLGTTDFWAARVVADLVSQELLTLANGAVYDEVDEEPADESPEDELAEDFASPYDTPERVYDEETSEDEYEDADEDATEEQPAGAPSHNQSWWKDPEAKDASAAAEEGADVEEDTEAFLEKVFSELEETDEENEGHGLLRRRRLGALRDLSGES
ncbi:MAG: DUF4388 domain-containing protein [Acidimicrobiia bacterium]